MDNSAATTSEKVKDLKPESAESEDGKEGRKTEVKEKGRREKGEPISLGGGGGNPT